MAIGVAILMAVACRMPETPGDAPGTVETNVAVASETQRRLRVATWNIEHLRSLGEPPLRRQKKDFERLRHYAGRLDADVIALQEIGEQGAAERVFTAPEYVVVLSRRNDEQRTGFAVRRRLRFERRPDFVRLDVGGLRHGVDLLVHLGGGQSVRLLAVHLKSGCFYGRIPGKGAGCRKFEKQIPLLEDWIDARAREGVPFVVLGDFNRRLSRSDPVWADWDDATPDNADLLLTTEGRRSACEGGRYPEYIDHILLGKLATRWYQADSFRQVVFDEPRSSLLRLSDHCPISIDLESAR